MALKSKITAGDACSQQFRQQEQDLMVDDLLLFFARMYCKEINKHKTKYNW